MRLASAHGTAIGRGDHYSSLAALTRILMPLIICREVSEQGPIHNKTYAYMMQCFYKFF